MKDIVAVRNVWLFICRSLVHAKIMKCLVYESKVDNNMISNKQSIIAFHLSNFDFGLKDGLGSSSSNRDRLIYGLRQLGYQK